ncbi:MAG: mandelate racemase/muconate lactonizing enzyme family protein [Pseudomonadota bacterium]
MRIVRIEIYQAELPVKGGVYRLSGGREYNSFDATFARVICDNGIEGWGESTPFGASYIASHSGSLRATLELLSPSILGSDPRHHDRRWDRMEEAALGFRDARAALDIACWDVSAKTAGMPLCDMVGGRVRGPVPVISSIGGGDPDEMRAKVEAHRKVGYLGHSVKVGASEAEGGPQLDAERIKACLANRKPGEWFLVDANNGLSPEHALRMLALLPDGLDFVLEAPCKSWRETLSLRARCNVPILLDELIQSEADLTLAIAQDACDGVGLKVTKQGGITPMIRQRTIASAAGMVMSIQDTTGSQISFAAALHIAQSTSRRLLRCALDPRMMVEAEIAEFDAPIRNGGAEAPNQPGLGVTPNLQTLGKPAQVYE